MIGVEESKMALQEDSELTSSHGHINYTPTYTAILFEEELKAD